MDERFRLLIESLHPSLEALLEMKPVRYGSLPRSIPSQGVYLFSEGDRHLYVGRTNQMKKRFGQHCRASSQHNQAVFAFKHARIQTGQTKAAYRPGSSSRSGLINDPAFADAFSAAKSYVRQLDIRFVEECDQPRQALLEMYCAIALNCPYNDFGNH